MVSWQVQCTDELKESVRSGRNGAARWEAFRAAIDPGDPANRIIIADAVFDNISLENYDLSRCYIVRTSFNNANLSGTDFRQAIFRSCQAKNANVEGALFRGSDMTGDGITLDTNHFNEHTDFEVAPDRLPDVLSAGLRTAALRARHARRWRNRKSYSLSVRCVMALTEYGFSLHRLAILGAVVIVAFSLIFVALGERPPHATLSSVGYFLGLDSNFTDPFLHAFGLLEGFLGILFFAVLTAVLVSLFFD